MTSPKLPPTTLHSYTLQPSNTVIRAGDCILLRPVEPNQPPYVAKVEKIVTDPDSHVRVHVRWYYRPEESTGGRRVFHGAKEVFLSNHFDVQFAKTIEGKCNIHSFQDYVKLNTIGAEDYFCRFEYCCATGDFKPDRVAVFCKCELPYNPDIVMVRCENCADWFHPRCIGMSDDEAEKLEKYTCSDCSAEQKKSENHITSNISNIKVYVKRPKTEN